MGFKARRNKKLGTAMFLLINLIRGNCVLPASSPNIKIQKFENVVEVLS